MTAFDAATETTPAGDGLHTAVCDTAWSAPRGPNGGYLAAIVLRAMQAEVADPDRAPRRGRVARARRRLRAGLGSERRPGGPPASWGCRSS